MPDPRKLPHLLKLLDDESQVVKQAVLEELAAFGLSLEEELLRLPQPPDARQREVLQNLFGRHKRKWLEKAWPSWFGLKSDPEKLETALTLLAEFQNGWDYPVKLKTLLDQLAEDYRAAHREKDERQLSKYLFQEKALKGVPESDYYNPSNSNLVYVIEKKRGIPISLVSIYMLVGHRLGLNIEGCHFPGHFLARFCSGNQRIFVDCFNGGDILDEKTILTMKTGLPSSLKKILQTKTDTETMVNRVLKNLMGAYQQAGDSANRCLMSTLLHLLEAGGPGRTRDEGTRLN